MDCVSPSDPAAKGGDPFDSVRREACLRGFRFVPIASLFSLLFLLFSSSCATVHELAYPAAGSILRPIGAKDPEGERAYLKRLRTPGGEVVEYQYRGAIPGPDGTLLDRFYLKNPAPCLLSPLRRLFDSMKEEPRCPSYVEIYMDLYGGGSFGEAVPGFLFLREEASQKSH